MKDVTLLIAHCDDEALFMWPFLDRVKRIVCASDDSLNPARVWCKERGKCLEEVGKLIGADVVHMPLDSEFYRMQTRNESLKCAAATIAGHLRGAKLLATHNAWGEYGHIDHILCHHIARTVQAKTGCELLVTDIATEINWLPIKAWKVEPFSSEGEFEIDRPLFDRIKAIYDARGCWTWSFEPVERCRVYSL